MDRWIKRDLDGLDLPVPLPISDLTLALRSRSNGWGWKGIIAHWWLGFGWRKRWSWQWRCRGPGWIWSGRRDAGHRGELAGVVYVLVRVLERRGVVARVFQAVVSSKRVLGGRLDARKIHRRCQGGAHSHEKESGTKIWRWAYLESPESMKHDGRCADSDEQILQPGGVWGGERRGELERMGRGLNRRRRKSREARNWAY
jgi:hypothetical protein